MKARVTKGGWWWLGVERCAGDVLEASDVQVGRWAADGVVEPIVEIRQAVVAPPEKAVAPASKPVLKSATRR